MAMDLNEDEIDLNKIPATALNVRSMDQLSRRLNLLQSIAASNGTSRDYRGLAELLNFEYIDIKNFEQLNNPALAILESWVSRSHQTVGMLISYLRDMERLDIIEDCEPFLKKDACSYMKRKKIENENPIQDSEVTSSRAANVRGLMEGGSSFNVDNPCLLAYPTCDAYLCYADEDVNFVFQLAHELENPPVNLKLFIRHRDMPAGLMEAAVQAQIIDEKCNRVLVILSPDFLRNNLCEFQTNFATGVATEKRMRKLIPILYKAIEDVPSVLKYYSKIDLTRPEGLPWVKERLIESIRGSSSTTFVASPLYDFQLERIAASSNPPMELPPSVINPIVQEPASEDPIPFFSSESLSENIAEPMQGVEAGSEESSSIEDAGSLQKPKKKVSKRIFRKLKGFISSSSTAKSSTASSGYQSQTSFSHH